jgi:hypothetical protein
MVSKSVNIFGVLTLLVLLAGGPKISDASCVLYDEIPSPLPTNVASVGFQATAINSMGMYVQLLNNTDKSIGKFSVVMSSWAPHSEHPSFPLSEGYYHNITLKLYKPNNANSPTTAELLYTIERELLVPWKPEQSANCSTGRFMDSNGVCWSGLAFTLTFDIGYCGPLMHSEFIYGIGFNTQSYGESPIGSAGPWNSLNMGVTTNSPSVGSNINPGTYFVDSDNAGTYSDPGPTGVFRMDSGLNPYNIIAQVYAADCISRGY